MFVVAVGLVVLAFGYAVVKRYVLNRNNQTVIAAPPTGPITVEPNRSEGNQ